MRLPEAALPTEADVVIVGGGYTGMMAAARLAWRGRAVALLERNELGWGASSRNGGMAHPGFKVGPSTVARRYGARGLARYRASLDAFALLEETIQTHRIDCDYERSGHVYLAYKPGDVTDMEAETRFVTHEFGLTARMIPREALHEEIGSPLYHGGMLFERSGGLHPAKYIAGLIRLARDRGAHLHDHTAAVAIERRRRGGFRIRTTRGSIECREVLIATNGYSDRLLPQLRRRVIPIGSYIIATEPLPPDLARETIPNRRMLFDSKNYLYYWRLTPDGRMLFGGRASLAPTTIPRARDWLYQAMVRVHPQLAGVKVENAWGGNVGFTFDQMPHIGRMDGITYALGYCGTGVVMSTYFGQLAADWIAGGELADAWNGWFPTAPFYRERPWFLPVVGWYFAAQDRFGR